MSFETPHPNYKLVDCFCLIESWFLYYEKLSIKSFLEAGVAQWLKRLSNKSGISWFKSNLYLELIEVPLQGELIRWPAIYGKIKLTVLITRPIQLLLFLRQQVITQAICFLPPILGADAQLFSLLQDSRSSIC